MASRVASRCYNRWNRGCSFCCIPQRRGGFSLRSSDSQSLLFSSSPVVWFSGSPPTLSPSFRSALLALTLTLRHDGHGHGILGASCSGFLHRHLGTPPPTLPMSPPDPNWSGIHQPWLGGGMEGWYLAQGAQVQRKLGSRMG